MSPLLGVQPSFLQAAIDQISLSYPAATFDQSMYAYLTQGLGLTQADIYVLGAGLGGLPHPAGAERVRRQRRRRRGAAQRAAEFAEECQPFYAFGAPGIFLPSEQPAGLAVHRVRR